MITNLIFFILIFFSGVLSFFSPCVLPLIPIYFGFLAGNGKKIDEFGNISYNQKKVFLNTVFFVLGISVSFFILGISFTTLGDILFDNKEIITKIGGALIILFGFFQLGIVKLNFLQRDRRIEYKENRINVLVAFITGFSFSFAWTPCVGPILSSVLIMASTLENKLAGNLLIIVYSLGFIIPFLFIGMFTTKILDFYKNKQKFLKYFNKIGGILLIFMGVLMLSGYTNKLSNYFIPSSNSSSITSDTEAILNKDSYRLIDQYGNEHILSNYKGKIIFLNFWATWCPPCKEEMPSIEEIYKEFGENKKDVIVLGIVNPKTSENPNAQDESIDKIKSFIKNGHYTFPTVFDRTGIYFDNFQIRAFPTTYIIGKDGEIKGIVPGAMTKQQMLKLINKNLITN